MKYPFTVYKTSANNHTFWIAESTLLRGCVGQGETADEAINELTINEDAWLNTATEYGIKIPEIPIGVLNEAVDLTQTADVQEIIHAHWVDGICTNCGVEKPIVTAYRGVSDIVYQYQGELNYCPNCGAKMDGGSE